jgi:hypothetical protein
MQKTCMRCSAIYQVAETDLAFYSRVSPVFGGKQYVVPTPTLCPTCRFIRRLAWKNERKLYSRPCDLCKQPTISIYSVDKPYTVYCRDCWWSDRWDPLECGRDFDPNRSFFDQYKDLLLAVPKQAVHQNNNAENCTYTTSTTRNRNSYLISSAGYNEDCFYGIFMPRNKNCTDNTHVMDSELCYECIDTEKGFHLLFCQNTRGCTNSAFLYDCHECSDCFFCYGLRGKQYVFRNEQLTKEEYEKKMSAISLQSFQVAQSLREEFQQFIIPYPRLYYEGQHNEDITACNHIFNSKNCRECYDADFLEDCRCCSWFNNAKDCQDVYAFGYAGDELCYECMEIGSHATRLISCMHCWDSVSDLLYCCACHTSHNLFGCTGLKRKEYCILNTQYTQEEYEQIVPTIIEKMIADGEWGEFFSPTFSHFGYNETMAMDFFPAEKNQILAQNWLWSDLEDEVPNVEKVIPAEHLPDKIDDIPDDILNWAIRCKATNRPFRIIAQELDFYRKMRLPIPHFHPDERHRQRMALRNPRTLWARTCNKCGKEIQTTYDPERPEKVLCEECYLKEVY